MRILMITANDPAGTAIAFSKAINRYSDHQCRLITTAEKYGFAYEKDLHLPDIDNDGLAEIEQLLNDADIFHFHILSDENTRLGPFWVKDFIAGKKILHHHHGHPHFRANPEAYREKYRRLGRKVLVSTPDLLHLLPEAVWLPNLVHLDDPLLAPAPEPPNPPVVIGHAPTRKELKNTADLQRAAAEIAQRKDLPPTALKIIEGVPHRRCLEEKRNCHMIFDHMQGYYGVSSLESLAQGRPVIAGLDEWNIRHIKEFSGCNSLPWTIARSREELVASLAALAADKELRRERGSAARRFMEKHWHPRQITQRLITFYQEL